MIAVILLAGGIGTRMNSPIPKQYLSIQDKPLACYSFNLFCTMPEIVEIVVVCAPEYRSHFQTNQGPIITFAAPGLRRQDSVYNGTQAVTTDATYLCIHDAVRPCITEPLVRRVFEAARQHGAATAAMPVKYTVKKATSHGLVEQTLDREHLWEIQTPQVMQRHLYQQGIAEVIKGDLTVTDDVSVVELLGLPVKLVTGSYYNIKVTTPEDLLFCEKTLELLE